MGLEGARHARGETAIDPITRKELPPPDQRSVDEATGWFLDYFSRRELSGWLAGRTNVLASVLLWTGVFGTLMVSAVTFALTHVERLDKNPGPLPALAIVIAGLSFSTVVFHLLRVKSALQLRAAPPARDVVERHLRSID